MISETRITLKNLGKTDPLSIDDFIEAGGYKALEKALRKDSSEIIDEMIASSLRGRGGAGFPAGLKEKFTSEACRRCAGRYLICNADEGEPGTFKDRIIMENDPHLLIEGMLIAAWAIQATMCYIYIRAEYYESIRKLELALNAARERGFLGRDIMGSGYTVDIEIKLGAGSYLCGEELTLMESLEGKRGYPRIKPPFPAEKGLFGMPTLINNVETLATVPAIVLNGSEWYMGYGTPESPGTKIFTISGDVNRPGYYETEMGIPLRALIYDLAGGVRNGLPLKAVLLGGAAGTFVDETVLDTPMGFDSLKEKGAVLGSGAVMVLAEGKSVARMIRSQLEFFKHESCGKCVPCRVGTDRLVRMMREHIDSGDKKLPSLDEMVQEAEYIAANSLCPLGQSPVLPLRSLQRYFSDHF